MRIRNAIWLVVMVEIAVGILGWLNYGSTLQALQATTRFSGRFSLIIFSFIFLFHNSTKFKLENILSPKYFLIFAIAHAIHLAELLSFVILSGNKLIPVRLAGGFLAYVIIFAMPWLDTRYHQGHITIKKYNLIIWTYLIYVWFIFFMSYLPRVQGKLPNVGGNYAEFVILLTWVSAMMGIKIQQLIMSSTKR